jgi:hypothetical protein
MGEIKIYRVRDDPEAMKVFSDADRDTVEEDGYIWVREYPDRPELMDGGTKLDMFRSIATGRIYLWFMYQLETSEENDDG